MSVRLLFPTYMFHRNLLDENLNENQGYDSEYNQMLIDEIDAMRKRDPKGRQVSNAMAPAEHLAGWQSKDGCERSPIFEKCMNRISRMFTEEVLPFHGIHKEDGVRMSAGNSWANINEKGSYNRPHTHPACWWSGVLYIKADGDEGNFVALDTMPKVLGNFPMHGRSRMDYMVAPRVGDLWIFPTGCSHMVEPNYTDKERYSISFNMEMFDLLGDKRGAGAFDMNFDDPWWNPDEFVFNLDEKGNPIR